MTRDCAYPVENGIGTRRDLFGGSEHQFYGCVKIRLQRVALWPAERTPGGCCRLRLGKHDALLAQARPDRRRFENEGIPPRRIADRLHHLPHLREKVLVAREVLQQQVPQLARLLSDEARERIEGLQIVERHVSRSQALRHRCDDGDRFALKFPRSKPVQKIDFLF